MSLLFDSGLVASTTGADRFIYSNLNITGAVHWVDSVNGNDSNPGTEEFPLATLSQAHTNATANNGDLILLKSGHVGALSSSVTLSKAGLRIYGVGSGSLAPNFYPTAAIDLLNITGANIEICNLYFPIGTTATNTARINVDAAGARIRSCTFLCGLRDSNTITVTANGLYALIESCGFTVSADGPDAGIVVESASAVGLRVSNCTFNGGTYGWDDAAIYSAAAHTAYAYDRITLTSKAHIIHTAAAKGWVSEFSVGDNCQVRI